MKSTTTAACAPARLSGLHAAPSPVPRRMPRLIAGANAEKAPSRSIPIRRARGCCRLRTSSGSRHCSLRVLQPVVGEHAASPHAPSAVRGSCVIRSALDKHLSPPTVPTGSWFFGSHYDTRAAPRVNFRPCYAGQRGGCSDIFRSVIEPRSLYHQASVWRLVPFSIQLFKKAKHGVVLSCFLKTKNIF